MFDKEDVTTDWVEDFKCFATKSNTISPAESIIFVKKQIATLGLVPKKVPNMFSVCKFTFFSFFL